MQSERYVITLFGIDSKYYANEYVSYLWEKYANNEYRKSKRFITGLVDKRSLVCGKIRGCKMTEYAHVISTVRNPIEIENTELFLSSLKNILNEMRGELGNPSMTITVEQVEYFYFV